ncbi:unnamed protein product, partial [marine sediment metagenome]
EIILEYNQVPEDKWYVDMDFPPIAPKDVFAIGEAIVNILGVMPEFGDSPDVKQIALMSLGINDPQQALEELEKIASDQPEPEEGSTEAKILQAVRQLKEAVHPNGKK